MSQTWEAMKADSKEARGAECGGGGALLAGHVGVSTFISGPFSQNNSGERVVQGLCETVSMRTGVWVGLGVGAVLFFFV